MHVHAVSHSVGAVTDTSSAGPPRRKDTLSGPQLGFSTEQSAVALTLSPLKAIELRASLTVPWSPARMCRGCHVQDTCVSTPQPVTAHAHPLQKLVSVVLHLLLEALAWLLGSLSGFQLVLKLHDFKL